MLLPDQKKPQLPKERGLSFELRCRILSLARSVNLLRVHFAFLIDAKFLMPYLIGNLLAALHLPFADANFLGDNRLFFDPHTLFAKWHPDLFSRADLSIGTLTTSGSAL